MTSFQNKALYKQKPEKGNPNNFQLDSCLGQNTSIYEILSLISTFDFTKFIDLTPVKSIVVNNYPDYFYI